MTVTVKELREFLATMPGNMVIVMQEDDEGNGYRYLRGIEGESSGPMTNYFDPRSEDCHRQADIKGTGRKTKDLVKVAVLF